MTQIMWNVRGTKTVFFFYYSTFQIDLLQCHSILYKSVYNNTYVELLLPQACLVYILQNLLWMSEVYYSSENKK